MRTCGRSIVTTAIPPSTSNVTSVTAIRYIVDEEITTDGGLPVERSTGPATRRSFERIGAPGQFPFTRGNFPDGYRDRFWTFRQYSGFGTAE